MKLPFNKILVGFAFVAALFVAIPHVAHAGLIDSLQCVTSGEKANKCKAGGTGADKVKLPTGELVNDYDCERRDGIVEVGAGNCTVCDALYLVVVVIEWAFGVIGFVMLLIFSYSGFQMVISQGNSSQWGAGRDGAVAAVIGLVIILASWQIVHLVTNVVTTGKITGNGNIFSADGTAKDWAEYCEKGQIRANPKQ